MHEPTRAAALMRGGRDCAASRFWGRNLSPTRPVAWPRPVGRRWLRPKPAAVLPVAVAEATTNARRHRLHAGSWPRSGSCVTGSNHGDCRNALHPGRPAAVIDRRR